MTRRRRALLLLPALAACYVYVPPRSWAANRSAPRRAPPEEIAAREPRREPPRVPGAPRPDESPTESGPEQELDPTGLPGDRDAPPLGDVGEARVRIVETARRYLGHRWAGDCSNFVRRVLRESGIDLGPLPSARTMSESLHLVSREVKSPLPGDLIFFHDTYDRNRDGRLNDPWSHVALVEAVEGSRVWILHRGGKGIIRLRMDRARPHDERENDPIRVRTRLDPPGTRYLTAELFSAYGEVVE